MGNNDEEDEVNRTVLEYDYEKESNEIERILSLVPVPSV